MPRIRLSATASVCAMILALSAPARAEVAADRAVEAEASAPGGPTAVAELPDGGASRDPPSRRRKWGSLGALTGIYSAATAYMYFAWYHGQPDLPSLKVGGDGWFGEHTYAGGADKLGHAWASLMLSRVSSEVLVANGWRPRQAALIASGLTLGLLTAFEVKDGFYTELSPGDAIFNVAGAGLNVAMLAYPPLDELLDFRVEYFPSREYRALLDGRRPPPDPAKPRQVSLNFVEDYSGQRYLLALHLGALPGTRGRPWARLVDVAVGYEADGYRPEAAAGRARHDRHLFLGLSVNMQGVLDLALAERRGRLARGARSVGHVVFELVNPPFGSAALVGARRSAVSDP